jgi:acyl carrier protein
MPADQIGTPSDIVVSEHDIRIAGHRLRYLRAGSGPAVVLVHGLLGYSFSWRFVMPYLAPHFTVYAPDQLGIGFSERVAGLDCSLRAHADRMLEFCERLGLDSLDLVELMMELEEEFGVTLEPDESVKTVGDLVAYVEKSMEQGKGQ